MECVISDVSLDSIIWCVTMVWDVSEEGVVKVGSMVLVVRAISIGF